MKDILEFVKPQNLVIIENDDEFVLRKGFIHLNEIVIDKNGSSMEFTKAMRKFIKDGTISLDSNDGTYDDFVELSKFGFIQIKMHDKFLVICNNNYLDIISKMCEDKVVVVNFEKIIDKNDIEAIIENKNTILISELVNKYKKVFSEYNHIYYVEDFCNVSRLRTFNRLMHELEIENVMGIIDSDNIYLTGIKPNYSGCYECLEKHIITKFQGQMCDYEKKYDYSTKEISSKEDIYLLMGMILKDMKSINIYGSSSLTGNVIHFYTPNFEYSFNANRINSSCSVCAKLSNILFEEQNMRSVNVTREALK